MCKFFVQLLVQKKLRERKLSYKECESELEMFSQHGYPLARAGLRNAFKGWLACTFTEICTQTLFSHLPTWSQQKTHFKKCSSGCIDASVLKIGCYSFSVDQNHSTQESDLTACNSSLRGSDFLFWSLQTLLHTSNCLKIQIKFSL